MKIKKDDTVMIIAGKDRGRKGKVIKAFPNKGKIVIEGLNIIKKHVKPRREGEKGKVVELPQPINVSNVKFLCQKCKKPTRIIYKVNEEKGRRKKYRACKKCNAEIIS